MNPRLLKYCKPEHNLARCCKTLFLGTFEYYRNIEGSIGDRDEGIGSFYVEYAKHEGIEYFHNRFERLVFPNCVMFCTTTNEVGAEHFDNGYSDKYFIDTDKDNHLFSRILGHALDATLASNRDNISKSPKDTTDVFLATDVYPIQYVDKKNYHLMQQMPEYRAMDIYFTKPNPYQMEFEVRFLFTLIARPSMKIINIKRPVIVKLDEYSNELKKCVALE